MHKKSKFENEMKQSLIEPLNKPEAFKEIVEFAKIKFGERIKLVILYGSAAYNRQDSKSDLDFLIVCENFSQIELKESIDFVIKLHSKYNISIDNEVPFSRKLLFTKNDFEDAIRGGGFIFKDNKFIIPPIIKTIDFLDSHKMGKRLALNAITTPNILIYGDKEYYDVMTKKAFENLIKIVYSALDIKNASIDLFIDMLIGEGEKSGEMFLGYKPLIEVREFLEKNLLNMDEFKRIISINQNETN